MIDFKVTRINNRWHIRATKNNQVIDEMACQLKSDIGWCCREIMRWIDKQGVNASPHSAAARRRHNNSTPDGKVWYQNQLN